MIEITHASAAQLTTWYREGSVSPVEAAEAAIAVAEGRGGELNAVAVLNADEAMVEAEASARRWAEGSALSPLDGVPVSVKDSFPMMGLKRWHGSRLNDAAPPSSRDGALVKRLREAGAVLFAKTSMPDFGLIGAGVSSQFGIIPNPWNTALNPGGSSSGSGVLLAIGAGPLSIGTDMGGSVRLPSALCGLVGLKPTQGRIAYDPPKIIGSAGPMARTVSDAAALLRIVGVPDASDHLSLPGRFEWDGALPDSLDGVRIGVLTETGDSLDVDPEVLAAVDAQARILERLGATVERIVEPVSDERGAAAFISVMTVRGLPELLTVPESEWHLLPPTLLASMSAKRAISGAEHVSNEKAMEAFRQRASAVLDRYDYVISPVASFVSFPAEATEPVGANAAAVQSLGFAAVYNLTSLPAGTVPGAMSTTGMPIGVQIGGRRFDDAGVLAIMGLLERERDFALEYPFAVIGGA